MRRRLGLFERDRPVLHERLGKGLGAEVDHPGELGDAAGGDHQVGDAPAHVDQGDHVGGGAVGGRSLIDEGGLGRESADHGERLQVDAADHETGLLGHVHELPHHLSLGGDQQDALLDAAVVVGVGREHLVVEDGLVDRDGDVLLGLELDRGPQLLFVDLRELHGADDDLLVRHPELDALACESALFPEDFEFVGQSVAVDDLALEHESFGKSADRSMRQHVVLLSGLDLDGSDGRLLQSRDPHAFRSSP